MNKKGIFMTVLAIFTLMMYSWTFYIVTFGSNQKYRETIGKNQVELYNLYMDGEKTILYAENAARLTAYDVILDMASNGGYVNGISECNNIIGYNVWYLDGRDCFPRELSKGFDAAYLDNFKKYMANYNEKLMDYYKLELKHQEKIEINGKGNDKLLFDARQGEIKYWINADFNEEIDYNFADYNEIKVIITEPIRLCKSAECFNDVIDKKNYDWIIVDRDEYVLFEVNTKKIIFNQPVVVKFAVKKES